MKNNARYSRKISQIQYICCMMIVILHSGNVKGWGLTDNGTWISGFVIEIQDLMYVLVQIAVPTFFMISGYLFFVTYEKVGYINKIKTKCKSLIIPYLFWNIFGFAFFAFLTYSPITSKYMNQTKVSLNISEVIINILNSKYTILWYVRNLLIYFIASPILYHTIKRKRYGIILIIVLCIYNLFVETEYYGLVLWLPMYLMGAYIGVHQNDRMIEDGIEIEKKWSLFISMLFFCILIITIISKKHYSCLFLYRFISPIFMWYLLDIIKWNGKISWWKEITFFIYCSHFFVISIFQKLMLIILGNNSFIALFIYIITPIVVVSALTLCAYILQKYMKLLWKVMIGGRISRV